MKFKAFVSSLSLLTVVISATQIPSAYAAPISLSCKNPGSHQDVAKKPQIFNSTNQVIPKGRTIFWQATDGDKGQLKLQQPLQPGKYVSGYGSAGQGYKCTAYYNPPYSSKPKPSIKKKSPAILIPHH